MVYIDMVHYETDSYGYEYITKVTWTNTFGAWAENTCTKWEMINFINQNPNCTKTKYYKNGTWYTGEDVHVVDNRYLRTDSNNIKADNLGNLPRF